MKRRAFHMLALLSCFALALPGCNEEPPTHQRVTIAGKTFNLELALTPAQIERGLMFRETLPDDGGMLFVFPGAQVRSFWMKNCLIPIDVVFLDPAGRIVSIREMTPPEPDTPDSEQEHYSSRWPAQFAIELYGGRADKLGLKTNQIIQLPLEELKDLVR
ncbi:MAG: DUF192 domain-containing protein [Planctomycetota bacterium]|jgi:uncharacterized membrane protein (UPF0127 family)